MAQRQIKLGMVLYGAGGPGRPYTWLDPDLPVDASVNIDWFVEQAQLAESSKFDLVFIVDSQFITKDSPPHYLNRLEPLTLLSALSMRTTHLGLVGTLTTSFNDPFNIACRLASLDLISHGRAGWNVVTSGDAGAAGNFSLDEHYDYDTRYGRGLEFVRACQALWDSYEDDAFPRNRATRHFLDPSRQHELNHKGEYFSIVGPLNIVSSKQRHPVIFQAGNSEQGRDLGGMIGEGIFTHAASIEDGQAFYNDIKGRAVKFGRSADDVVILPGIQPYIGDTDEDARELEREIHASDNDFERSLAELGRPFGWHDFSQYDLDAPFPQEALKYAEKSFFTAASAVAQFAKENDLTLRETVERRSMRGPGPFTGSAETVANTMQEWFEKRALDGFNITVGHPRVFRRFVDEVLPILRERGVLRTEYESDTLRGNLGLPVPENRHTRARRLAAAEASKPEEAPVLEAAH